MRPAAAKFSIAMMESAWNELRPKVRRTETIALHIRTSTCHGSVLLRNLPIRPQFRCRCGRHMQPVSGIAGRLGYRRAGGSDTCQSGILTVRFRKFTVAAGDPTTYGRMPLGSGAWVDRPVNDAEPAVLRQETDQGTASSAREVLQSGERFWKFVRRNTNAGHFEVLRSEPAFKRYRVDPRIPLQGLEDYR